MSRFYVNHKDVKGKYINIRGEEAHHLSNVMRIKEGDRVVLFDGEGKEYTSIIKTVKKSEVTAEIIKTDSVSQEEAVAITLAQAIPKKSKIDFIIEKATELGVDSVIPIYTKRTVVRLDKEKKDSRQTRWGKIAVSASKQCGRTKVPKIYPVTEFDNIVERISDYDLALMACLSEDTRKIKEVIKDFKGKKILVFIGPEGDFTKEEMASAGLKGCEHISLGPRVLRVDTAALNILSILRYEIG